MEGWGVGDAVQPHAAGPGRDAMEEGPGGEPKAQQLRVAGCVKGAADVRGQWSEVGGSWQLARRSHREVGSDLGIAGACIAMNQVWRY
jgi:hypothetical protein